MLCIAVAYNRKRTASAVRIFLKRCKQKISRVLYMTIIYLVRLSPAASSDLPESRSGKSVAFYSVLLRMGFTYAPSVTGRAVVSYTALPPLPGKPGGTFLLHYPWSRLHRTLSGILPCEARTFLTCPLSGALRLTAATIYLTCHVPF